ncbi:MAG: RNA methyltransferase [Bacteroidetes bacterium]|nr:RNA methyltransferase [Bacteroidota bacterium]
MKKLSMDELNRMSVQEFKQAQKTPIVIILDNIRSLNNIGAIFRTADAFLLEGIYLCGITATPPHREIQKTALGATESVNWKHFENISDAVEALKKEHFKIISIEQVENPIYLNDFQPNKGEKYAIVLGNEVEGVSQDVINQSDYCIEVPQLGTKHSLNVSVCAGILIWDLFVKMRTL